MALTAEAVLPPELRNRIDRSTMARDQIAGFRFLNMDFFPRDSHLITFRDPWSFPTLYHPSCNHLVRKHMDDLAQKVGILNISRSTVSQLMLNKGLDRLHLRLTRGISYCTVLSPKKSVA